MENDVQTAVADTSAADAALSGGLPDAATMDAELASVFDRMVTNNGADRAADGKFASPNPPPETPSGETDASSEVDPQSEGEAAAEDKTLTEAVPLPPSWQHKAEAWGKLPREAQEAISEHEQGIQRTLSDNGRQMAALKPMQDVVKAYEPSFANLKKADGSPIKPHEAVATLFQAHKELTTNPVGKLMQLAETFGVKDALAESLGIQSNQAPDVKALLAEISGLKQAIAQNRGPDVEQVVEQKLSAVRAVDANVAVYEAFAEKNPLIREIPPADLLPFIEIAKTKLGDTAAPKAVLERAYDMAVNADPALRAKTAAKPAPVVDAKKAEEAKRATSVNVTSTSTGKAREVPLDEELGAIWDKNRKG